MYLPREYLTGDTKKSFPLVDKQQHCFQAYLSHFIGFGKITSLLLAIYHTLWGFHGDARLALLAYCER